MTRDEKIAVTRKLLDSHFRRVVEARMGMPLTDASWAEVVFGGQFDISILHLQDGGPDAFSLIVERKVRLLLDDLAKCLAGFEG